MSLHELETWMWAESCEILDKAARLHRQFFKPVVMNAKKPTWEPPVDIYETGYEFKILIALPGIAPEQLTVNMESGHIVIDGHRHISADEESHIHRMEIPYGQFERRIELPAGRFEIGAREFANGCLLISLRKI